MIADLVFEITATAGTGPFTLGGARSADFRTFAAAHSVGDTVYYAIRGGGQWETGLGTLTSANVLARTTVYNGSAGAGVAVNFNAGNKDIYETINSGAMVDFPSFIASLPAASSLADDDMLLLRKNNGSLQSILGSIIKAAGGGIGTPTVSSVSVSPSTATVAGAGTQTFTATVNGTNAPSQSVTWTASAGSITSGGVFTAPAATGSTQTITITATSVADNTKSGTATVTVAAAASTVSGVTVSPSTANVAGGATQQFSATVAGTNSPSQGVNWTASAGTINSSGLFTAPAATGSIQTITVTATSQQDATKSGTATVTVAASAGQTNAQRWSKVEKASFHTLTDPAAFTGGTTPNEYFSQDLKILVVNPSDANDYPAASVLKVVWIRTATGAAAPTSLPSQFQWSGSAWPSGVPYNANGGNTSNNVPNSITTMGHFNVGSYPGVFNLEGSLFGGGADGDYWPVVLFPDGSFKSMNMKVSVS